MIAELLQPAGPELARRWLAALLLVPRGERAAVVASVEKRIVQVYASGKPVPEDDRAILRVAEAPRQREGYVEQRVTSYRRPPARAGEAKRAPRKRRA